MLSRRDFLTGTPFLPYLLLGSPAARAEERSGRGTRYRAEAKVLFGFFGFRLEGSIDEQIDRASGRYRVVAAGRDTEVENRLESHGFIRARRFTPAATHIFFNLRGRESRTAITYDHDRGVIDYSHVSHTFFLRRRREVRGRVHPHPDQHVDDILTLALNYAEKTLPTDATGAFRAHVVRWGRPEGEEPGEMEAGDYRAEIVPFVFREVPDRVAAGRTLGVLDLTPLTSWAQADRPARIVFGPDRRPESIEVNLIFGSSVHITFTSD